MEWISVKERLPETQTGVGDQVIVNSYVKGSSIENVVMCGVYYNRAFYNLERWLQVSDDEIHKIEIKTVSHWMALPAPPTHSNETKEK